MKSDCHGAEVLTIEEDGARKGVCSECGFHKRISPLTESPQWPSDEEIQEAYKAWADSEEGDYFQGHGWKGGVAWMQSWIKGEQ